MRKTTTFDDLLRPTGDVTGVSVVIGIVGAGVGGVTSAAVSDEFPSQEVQDLKAENAALKAENSALESKVQSLEKEVMDVDPNIDTRDFSDQCGSHC